MKIEHFDLHLIKDEEDKPYVGGDEVKGLVEMVIGAPVTISRLSLRIYGEARTAWYDKRTGALYNTREFVLDEYMDLTRQLYMHCNPMMEFHPGRHRLEFQTKLPLDVISSIERDCHGSVRYTAMAILDVPENGDSQIVAERNFKVVSFLSCDAPYLREPVTNVAEYSTTPHCFSQKVGRLKVEMEIAELGVLPGETVRIELRFESTLKKRRIKMKTQKYALLSLCQQLDFRSQSASDPCNFARKSVTLAVHSQGVCKTTPDNGSVSRFVEFDIPENLPPTSSTANKPVICSYFFRLNMQHFNLIVPVIVGSVKTFGDEVFR